MKTKRYWLIGGLLAFVISVLIYSFLLTPLEFLRNITFTALGPVAFLLGRDAHIIEALLVFFILNTLIGVALGVMYGKIKNRKSSNLPGA